MGEKDIKRLTRYLKQQRRASLAGNYKRVQAMAVLINRVIYGAALFDGLQIENTDTWKVEVIEL